jgi:hypothetical protein
VAGTTADRKTYWTHDGRTTLPAQTANNISQPASCGLPDGQDRTTLSQPHNINPSTAKNPVDTTGPVCDDKPAGKHKYTLRQAVAAAAHHIVRGRHHAMHIEQHKTYGVLGCPTESYCLSLPTRSAGSKDTTAYIRGYVQYKMWSSRMQFCIGSTPRAGTLPSQYAQQLVQLQQ